MITTRRQLYRQPPDEAWPDHRPLYVAQKTQALSIAISSLATDIKRDLINLSPSDRKHVSDLLHRIDMANLSLSVWAKRLQQELPR